MILLTITTKEITPMHKMCYKNKPQVREQDPETGLRLWPVV
jgi:hypothetical protein